MPRNLKRNLARPSGGGAGPVLWHLRLYIADCRGRSVIAVANLEKLCTERLQGHCRVEIVDLVIDPARAKRDEIVAIPTLERTAPKPVRRVLGDLSNFDRVLSGLELV